ncbi:PepSY-associated TM helix domain-containing protein [uncultured Cytophaga sp.]|uniref:PepSY-associated TM helix domain-containing protein n=1 Tax=uncultured Cytophaga sp. TaxID=160238 RepID=UPI00261A3DAD|nr:PepSY-associated TM helix domain-containing protein [uncultured Cytophaga sp.]
MKTDKHSTPKNVQTRSFKKAIGWLHLWLGLISGSIMFIVCITGCIWVFQEEITNLLQPWNNVASENKSFLLPSQVNAITAKEFPKKEIHGFNYQDGKALHVHISHEDEYNYSLYLNPYSGAIVQTVKHEKDEFDFFRFILNGHRFLWLPWKVGRQIINYATLTFVLLLVSGIILWWPKNKSAAKQRFSFKWKDTTKWKRKNYDLHNILGFYAMIFLLLIALTGMQWGLKWFNHSLYFMASGGETKTERMHPHSDSLRIPSNFILSNSLDKAWAKVIAEHPAPLNIYMDYPHEDELGSTIGFFVTPKKIGGFQYDLYDFDQFSLKNVSIKKSDKYIDAKVVDIMERMYYGIHVGEILGFPGKCIAFIASLTGATLPITGVYIWWGRRKKEKKGKSKEAKILI